MSIWRCCSIPCTPLPLPLRIASLADPHGKILLLSPIQFLPRSSFATSYECDRLVFIPPWCCASGVGNWPCVLASNRNMRPRWGMLGITDHQSTLQHLLPCSALRGVRSVVASCGPPLSLSQDPGSACKLPLIFYLLPLPSPPG